MTEAAPVAQGVGGQLRTVVTADEAGMAAPALDDAVEAGHGGIGVDGVTDEIGQRLAGEFVDDVEELDGAARGGDVELVVEGPYVVRVGGSEPAARCRGLTQAPALATLRGHSQAFLTPQTLDLLAIHLVALANQHGVRPPVPPPRMGGREAPQPFAQVPVRVRLTRFVALGGAVLADDAACPSLRQTEAFLQHVHGTASPRRAHQFPRLISRNASISSSLSATIRFSRALSRSNSLSRLASSAFIPPN